jgi:hypothetical protein
VTYKTGFRVHDWIYWVLYIHTVRGYRQYSAIAILHSLQFTVTHALGSSASTSRILATDLLQITYGVFFSQPRSCLAIILQLPIPKIGLNSISVLPSSYVGRLASWNSTLHSQLPLLSYCSSHYSVPSSVSFYNTSTRTTQKTTFIVRRRVYCSVT